MEELLKENQELLKNNQELKARVKELEEMLEKRIKNKNTTAHDIIFNLITAKVDKEVHEDHKNNKNSIKSLKREIMDDLKWDLHVRFVNDFKTEHIEQAKEFLSNYEIDKYYKFPRGSF